MNSMMKMAFFTCNFQFDKRPAVEACLANISFVNGTYGQAYQAVLRLVQNIVVGSTDSRHHMKALTPPTPLSSTKNEPCRGFAAGRCRFGDKCKYSHKTGPTAPPPRPPPKQPAADGSKTAEGGKPGGPSFITAHHRELVGPPLGKSTHMATPWLLSQADECTQHPGTSRR